MSKNFGTKDQALSAVQAAKSLAKISKNSTPDELAAAYQDIKKSLECMGQTMPGKQEEIFDKIGELMLDTDEKTEAYLDMNEEISGTPIQSAASD